MTLVLERLVTSQKAKLVKEEGALRIEMRELYFVART